MGTVTIFCWVPLPGTTDSLTKVESVSIKWMQLTPEDRRGRARIDLGMEGNCQPGLICSVKKMYWVPFLWLECATALCYCIRRSHSTLDRVVKYLKLIMRALRKHKYVVLDNPWEEDFGFQGSRKTHVLLWEMKAWPHWLPYLQALAVPALSSLLRDPWSGWWWVLTAWLPGTKTFHALKPGMGAQICSKEWGSSYCASFMCPSERLWQRGLLRITNVRGAGS